MTIYPNVVFYEAHGNDVLSGTRVTNVLQRLNNQIRIDREYGLVYPCGITGKQILYIRKGRL